LRRTGRPLARLSSKGVNREDFAMITAIVRFKLPATVDAAKAAEMFEGSAPK
jgi:hypothetical protein